MSASSEASLRLTSASRASMSASALPELLLADPYALVAVGEPLALLAESLVLPRDRLLALRQLVLAAVELGTLFVQLRVRDREGLALGDRLLATSDLCLALGQRPLEVAERRAHPVQLGGLLALAAAHLLHLPLRRVRGLEPPGRFGVLGGDVGVGLRNLRLARGHRLLSLLDLLRARVNLAGLLPLRLLAGARLPRRGAPRRAAPPPASPSRLPTPPTRCFRVDLAVLERTLPLEDPAPLVRRLAGLALGGSAQSVRALLQGREPLAPFLDRLLVVIEAPLAPSATAPRSPPAFRCA